MMESTQVEEAGSSGWPLGLQPVSLRMRLMEVLRASEPNSFIATTPSFSSVSSSDLDTESTFSFFPDKSITLGTLIGIRTDQPLRRSLSYVHPESHQPQFEVFGRRSRSTSSSPGWRNLMKCVGFKGRQDTGVHSLGHFLQAERRAGGSGGGEKVYINIMYEETEGCAPGTNPLFLESLMAAPSTSLRAPSADLPVIEESPARASPIGALEIRTARHLHRRSQSHGSCMANCVLTIWERMSPSGMRASQATAPTSWKRTEARSPEGTKTSSEGRSNADTRSSSYGEGTRSADERTD